MARKKVQGATVEKKVKSGGGGGGGSGGGGGGGGGSGGGGPPRRGEQALRVAISDDLAIPIGVIAASLGLTVPAWLDRTLRPIVEAQLPRVAARLGIGGNSDAQPGGEG